MPARLTPAKQAWTLERNPSTELLVGRPGACDEPSISLLHEGTLRVQYDERQPMPPFGVGEFGVHSELWQIGLAGSNTGPICFCSRTKAIGQQRTVRSFTQVLHRIDARAHKTVTDELINAFKKVDGKEGIPTARSAWTWATACR